MLKKILFGLFLSASIATVTMAQPPFDPLDPNPGGIPVDGGASLLLASGVAFGLKKLKEGKKAAAQTQE